MQGLFVKGVDDHGSVLLPKLAECDSIRKMVLN